MLFGKKRMDRYSKLSASLTENLKLIQISHDEQFLQFIVNLWQLALKLIQSDQGNQGADAQRKHLGVRRGICIEPREIPTWCNGRA